MLAHSEGTLRDAAFDTRDRLWAFRQVGGTNWIAYAGVDAESALAPTRTRAVAALVLIVVIVGATIIAAAYSARRIARPIGAIAEVARARASGALDARAAIDGPREVADVAVAFNTLIDTRERVTREREIAQGKLQLQLSRLNLLHRITRAIGERHGERLGAIVEAPAGAARACQADAVLLGGHQSQPAGIRLGEQALGLGLAVIVMVREIALHRHRRLHLDRWHDRCNGQPHPLAADRPRRRSAP